MMAAIRPTRILQLLVVLLIVVLLSACETLGYYQQAARGQLAILWSRQDIEKLLAGNDITGVLRNKLTSVLAIRQFAIEELQLPAGDNFLSYVEIDREHLVWNVFAAPEFSMDPVNWCYPIAGCVSYRGYFQEEMALQFANQLESEEGLDVYTGGVDAYSTLGWFKDPVPSTVLDRKTYQLAGLVFHEFAHQLVYLSGDTRFNESFATAVEQEGLRRWLRAEMDVNSLQQAEQEASRQAQFVELVMMYKERFETLYAQEMEDEEKRLRKRQLQDDMRSAYDALKNEWGGVPAYDGWFSRSLNNAQLSTVSSYNELVPAFQKLLSQNHNNLTVFYEQVRELAQLDAKERNLRLQSLMEDSQI